MSKQCKPVPMQSLPGFRDFLPDDCARRNYVFARWREVTRRYGFVEWEGPPLESTELYKKKSGAEIVDQLFNFTDKGEPDDAADVELVALCIDILRGFGFSEKDFVVRISDREFWTDFLRANNVPADRWEQFLQAIDKFGREPREKTAQKL